ncbi:MAG: DUF1707 and DUF4190 domain-containing protein [Streptosporangiaceae bacterium]
MPGPGPLRPPGGGQMRASDQDRDATASILQTAFAEGRLSQDEYEDRVGRALTARTFAELDALTADLPGRRPFGPAAPRHTNQLAVASLICGAAQPFTGMLTTIPAIVLGHIARHQIRRTGEDGAGLATCGLALGWAGVAIPLLALLVFFLVVVRLF